MTAPTRSGLHSIHTFISALLARTLPHTPSSSSPSPPLVLIGTLFMHLYMCVVGPSTSPNSFSPSPSPPLVLIGTLFMHLYKCVVGPNTSPHSSPPYPSPPLVLVGTLFMHLFKCVVGPNTSPYSSPPSPSPPLILINTVFMHLYECVIGPNTSPHSSSPSPSPPQHHHHPSKKPPAASSPCVWYRPLPPAPPARAHGWSVCVRRCWCGRCARTGSCRDRASRQSCNAYGAPCYSCPAAHRRTSGGRWRCTCESLTLGLGWFHRLRLGVGATVLRCPALIHLVTG